MSEDTKTGENQAPVNGYILRAVTRIIVPKGMEEVEVLVGNQKITVKSSGDESKLEEEKSYKDTTTGTSED